jgi:tetratricopeptide (TPR) repeat protein
LDGLTAEALRHLETALACDPNHIPSLIALSNAYLNQREFAKVRGLLEQALNSRQDQGEVFFLKAKLHNLQEENEDASNAIDQAIKLDEGQSKYYKLASEIARMRGTPHERQFFLERLIDLEPLDGEAHYEFGKLLHHPDDFDRAKLLLEISIDLLPQNTQPLYSLAQHLYDGEKSLPDGTVSIQSDPDYAKRLLSKLLLIKPCESKAKLLLAQIELKGDAKQVAESLYMEAFKDEKTKGEAAFRLGLIWEEKGNREKSMRFYKVAMKFDEWKAFGEFRLGLLLLEEGKLKNAEDHFRQCLTSFEKKTSALMKSKELHLEKLHFHQSRKELEALQAVRKCAGEASFGIYKCNYDSRFDEKVSQHLDEALKLYPHYSEANHEKGLFFLASKDFENANSRFVKSVENDWNYWPSHLELGKIAKDNDEWQKAEMHFKIVLDLDPKNKTASKILDELRKALPD